MKYGIAIFPSKKLQDLANSYRKRYDSHYALIPPHLTLKEPFEVDEDQIGIVTEELDRIAEEISPFLLRVLRVSSFNPANNTIYLKVEPNEELEKLHELLYSGSLKTEQHYSFIPHITIGQDLSDDEHSDVLGRLRMENIQHEETADRFQLLYQLDNGSWTVYETFLLGKDRKKK